MESASENTNYATESGSGSSLQRMLTEPESASYAGVSVETLRGFVDAGVLQTTNSDSGKLYRESDLRTVFQISGNAPESTPETTTASSVSRGSNSQLAAPAAPDNVALSESACAVPTSAVSTSAVSTSAVPTSDLPPLIAPEPANTDETPYSSPDLPKEVSSGLIASDRALRVDRSLVTVEHEARLIPPYDLIESNRGLRAQIEVLCEERDWLRTRLENLEESRTRDQRILLTEAESLKEMITAQARKKSFWGFLPWMKS